MSAFIEVRNLEIVYGRSGTASVGPLSFDIHRGECLGLVGESGAGKTTIGLDLLGLLGWKGGKRIAGSVTTNLQSDQMAFIPQDALASLDPLFSIGHQMREVGGRRSLEAALRKVHLDPAKMSAKSYPHELSGGMRQRVVIAMALLREPQFIVADEPTSSLDVTLQAEIIKLFREIKAGGMTFLFVTHNLPLAGLLCDRVAIMKLGKIVEIGPVREVFSHSTNPYTRKLLQAVPKLKR